MPSSPGSFVLGMLTGGGLLLAGLLLGGQNEPPEQVHDVVRTRRVEIVDDLGTVRAALGSNAAGGTLSVRDRLGRTILLASAAEHGGVLVVNNTDSRQPAFMAGADQQGGAMQVFSSAGLRVVDATGHGGGRITVAGKTGVPAVRLEGGPAGSVSGFDGSGRPTFRLSADAASDGRIETYHPASGVALVTLAATADHSGLVRTSSPKGRPLVLISASSRREGQIFTSNEDGQPLIALATRPEGPTLRVYNGAGQPAVTLESDPEQAGAVGIWSAAGDGRVIGP